MTKRIISSIIKTIKPAGQKCNGRIVTAEPKITTLVSSQHKEGVISLSAGNSHEIGISASTPERKAAVCEN